MKTMRTLALAGLCFWAASAGSPASIRLAGFGLGEGDSRTTVTIKGDGGCVVTSEHSQSRKMMEFQVRSWERYASLGEAPEEDPSAEDASKPTAKAGTQPLSDEELAKKIREMYSTRLGDGQDDAQKIETLEVTTNTVRVVLSQSFASLKEMLSESPWSWGPHLLMVENTRIETDTNGLLRVTFSPSQGAGRYARSMGRHWKTAKTRFAWRLVFPGRVVSSGLPETRDNTTGVTLDADKPETVDAVLKLIGHPIVITAESGGVKVAEALESRKLMRTARTRSEPDLPVADAGPGYIAEPVSLMVSTLHQFPEGEKHLKDRPAYTYAYGGQSTGTVVTAKLFPPKGRTIRSVSGLRVVKSRDDKGRAIAGTGGEEADGETSLSEMTFNFGDSDRSGAARLDLRLGLPADDAQTIEEIEAEGIVFTIGGWKEVTVTNVQADAKKEIDLGELLPGATLVITKVTAKRPQTTVQARLEGPADVAQLEVKLKMDEGRGSTHMSQHQSRTAAGKTTRSITVQGYDYEMDGGAAPGAPVTLIVRSPQDPKRERVRFKLTALDLL